MSGLEILGVCLIDVDNKDLSLFAVQTPSPKTLHAVERALVDWYLLHWKRKKKHF
ncbi:hypothetical protein [Phocaeicola paurosaccharolyticus]|uniref:hypothetical protein n=1 Tax=Phocaeicola paurosaccharolyticus TaxID=732242 RepID=UPI002FDF1997